MLRSNPHLIEINARLWINQLRKKYSEDITLSAIPEEELLKIKHLGFDVIWLMGVWEPSPQSAEIARKEPELIKIAKEIIPDFNAEKIGASPYSIYEYKLNSNLGLEWEIRALKERLNSLGIGLFLDFVSNHMAKDNPCTNEYSQCFVNASAEDCAAHPGQFFETEINGKKKYIAYGRDPNFSPWTDTAQLNFFNSSTREKMLQVLLDIADMSDGARCDMVMLTLNDIYEGTWGWLLNKEGIKKPDSEFWAEAIKKVKQKYPKFIFIAEVYWGLEWRLQKMGFDYTYDKAIYDRLKGGDVGDVRGHLRAEKLYQKCSVRFIDNHDEMPSVKSFGREKAQAAAIIISTIKGLRFYQDAQLDGAIVKVPVQFIDYDCPVDLSIRKFYEKLLKIVDHPAFHGGEWNLLEVDRFRPENKSNINILSWSWSQMRTVKIVVVNYSGETSSGIIRTKIKSSDDNTVLFEELSGRFISFSSSDIQDGLKIENIPPYSAYILDMEF
ncbi:MAG: glycosidase [Elusimicrobia bacterium]|nr:glycosidase [Elusimicrobiota bacterium]